MSEADRVFFWNRVERTSGCWWWKGAKTPKGYGTTYVLGKPVSAHRVAWVVGHGSIPAGLFVLHHCDERLCVNFEDCLFLGTNSDNMKDAWSKGRGRCFAGPGEQNPNARLTRQDVEEIRTLHRASTYTEIARLFGISRNHARNIVLKKVWL